MAGRSSHRGEPIPVLYTDDISYVGWTCWRASSRWCFNGYFLCFCYRFQFAVGNGNGPGYPLRTIIWGKTVFNAGHSHAKSNAHSCNRQHTPCHYMDKHYTHSTFFGQDHEISVAAGEYACFMVPSLFAYGLLQCLVKFLQTQNIVFPMMICSGITTFLHILICWVMVFKSGLGFRGAALANSISNWFNVFLLVLYVKLSPSCAKTWAGFSKEAFHNIFTFLRLAIPSAIMVCLEMWSFEMMVLLSGLLPNPKLQTSALSICLNTAATVWMIPFGLSGAVSTRVSNELGAGNPEAARLAVNVVIAMAIFEALLVGSILMLIRNILGYAYSNEVEVVKYVAALLPLVAISNLLDSLQCILSGNARGCGWQKIGAYINLGSYYIVGIPCAVLLAFVLNVGGKGLWLGIICALAVQVTSLSIVTIRTNWEQEARKATERVYDYAISAEIVT
ncbi:hypothetical protein ES319_A11G004700v1 [Gossypium barbadense]|uniref:Protein DETOXIFICATION n=2 Tax=Gossypium TaxID=3633 RepID=A0A5J5TH48_GOSBA|nr:hypothetical protein ES319_A11G004700v1 [Gossypium barbadense]TYG92117.1 hypothetical protein ES288_A11G004600v1 [Gossypium darwinii]